MNKAVAAGLMAASVAACQGGYAGPNYQPVVDTAYTAHQKKIPYQEAQRAYAADLAYCQDLASQRSVVTAGSQSGAVGGIVGAGAGALGGVLYGGGNVAEGALIGAASGLLTTATYGAMQGNTGKQDIVIECLRKRGHDVVAR